MRMQCAEPSLSAPAREQPGGSPAGAQSPAVTTMKSVMEAKVRDLQNQLEYLRAQLASELICKVRVSRECLSPFRRGCMLDLAASLAGGARPQSRYCHRRVCWREA